VSPLSDTPRITSFLK